MNAASSDAASAIAPAIRVWRRISATFASTSSSGVESTITQPGSPAAAMLRPGPGASPATGNAVSPIRLPSTVSMPERTSLAAAAPVAAG